MKILSNPYVKIKKTKKPLLSDAIKKFRFKLSTQKNINSENSPKPKPGCLSEDRRSIQFKYAGGLLTK